MKLTTMSVAAAALVVFAQSAQAREHYRHHRYHAAHFARHYSSPRGGDDARQNMFADHGQSDFSQNYRSQNYFDEGYSQRSAYGGQIGAHIGGRPSGAVGRCGSLSPAIQAPRSIWRATGRIGDRPDRQASARSWSGRTTSARSSARRAASGSSNLATTATGFAPGRARSAALSPFVGDDRITRNVQMNARGPLGKPGGPYASCTSCTATTPRRQ
jgi:hypothetical protein